MKVYEIISEAAPLPTIGRAVASKLAQKTAQAVSGVATQAAQKPAAPNPAQAQQDRIRADAIKKMGALGSQIDLDTNDDKKPEQFKVDRSDSNQVTLKYTKPEVGKPSGITMNRKDFDQILAAKLGL